MGLDLSLFIITGDCHQSVYWIAHSAIETPRWDPIYSSIGALEDQKGELVPESFRTFRGRPTARMAERLGVSLEDLIDHVGVCYGDTRETPYGEKIKWVTARDLVKVIQHAVSADEEPSTQDAWAAVIGYLNGCRSEQKIALYWH